MAWVCVGLVLSPYLSEPTRYALIHKGNLDHIIIILAISIIKSVQREPNKPSISSAYRHLFRSTAAPLNSSTTYQNLLARHLQVHGTNGDMLDRFLFAVDHSPGALSHRHSVCFRFRFNMRLHYGVFFRPKTSTRN